MDWHLYSTLLVLLITQSTLDFKEQLQAVSNHSEAVAQVVGHVVYQSECWCLSSLGKMQNSELPPLECEWMGVCMLFFLFVVIDQGWKLILHQGRHATHTVHL